MEGRERERKTERWRERERERGREERRGEERRREERRSPGITRTRNFPGHKTFIPKTRKDSGKLRQVGHLRPHEVFERKEQWS
jgi:hypothetical protein